MKLDSPYCGVLSEKIFISGKEFLVPNHLRFILTFNVDETTEILSPRLKDRMPVIVCEEQIDSLQSVVREKTDYPPISASRVATLLTKGLQDSLSQDNRLLDRYDSYESQWATLPDFKISPRKRRHIEVFLQLISEFEDVDEDFVLDFIGSSFLLTKISGIGAEYKEAIEELVKNLHTQKTKQRLQKILNEGARYNQFRYI